MSQNLFPRRYYIDEEGRRVLIGLTVEQTREFELLEVTDSSNDVDRANLNLARWLGFIGCTRTLGISGEQKVQRTICPGRFLAGPL
jgi:hypothetical protein